ncbi:hypothetical protein QJS04_geneDACA009539 [Acorus gramineus]|uniref:Uncharacterized protein n=1 Tax=Acorus gramineus TaxID=55184 RepID=A0AAV9AHN3_ACOGR|nr:hypothetical protein QJS04_geneDACA009539 [Acorus gramineus]
MAYPTGLRNLFVLMTLVTLVVLLPSSNAPAEARIIGGRTKFMENDQPLFESLERGPVTPPSPSSCTNVPGRPDIGVCPPPNANMNFVGRIHSPKPEFHNEGLSN